MMIRDKKDKYAGIVWVVSALSLVLYGTLVLTHGQSAGVERLIDFLLQVESGYIYTAAFLSILLEGLYIVGSFFPGATLVVLLAIISQAGGASQFLLTIALIFFGWCTAGGINIVVAKRFGTSLLHKPQHGDYTIRDRPWTTWFPAFRANYEVAQVIEGGAPLEVFQSSVRVKFLVSLVMLLITALLPLVLDINSISNEEGVASIFVVAAISLSVGIIRLRAYLRGQNVEGS